MADPDAVPPASSWHDEAPLRVGISSCLLGEAVRWNGEHRRHAWVCETLGAHVEWVSVCPEVELGLGVPREPLRLVEGPVGPRLVGDRTCRDRAPAMRRFARKRVRELRASALCGYVFKARSPSCGWSTVPLWNQRGEVTEAGRGLFAAAWAEAEPALPVEEESGLADPERRGAFVERLYAAARLQRLLAGPCARRDLVAFHAAHKLQLMAHSPSGCRRLGRLVAQPEAHPRAEWCVRFAREFSRVLGQPATRKSHTNALQHAAGYFRTRLDAPTRRALGAEIEAYRRGRAPLLAPLTLLRHYAEREGVAYLEAQLYLHPHPVEQRLRNAA